MNGPCMFVGNVNFVISIAILGNIGVKTKKKNALNHDEKSIVVLLSVLYIYLYIIHFSSFSVLVACFFGKMITKTKTSR